MYRLVNGKEYLPQIILFRIGIIYFILYSDPDILIEKKVKDMKKSKDDSKENFDFSDVEKNSQDGFSMVGQPITTLPEIPSFETELENLSVGSSNMAPVNQVISLQTVSMDKLEISSFDGASSTVVEKDNEISSCVVCDKKFKSKSCMNKHLRSVHAGSNS